MICYIPGFLTIRICFWFFFFRKLSSFSFWFLNFFSFWNSRRGRFRTLLDELKSNGRNHRFLVTTIFFVHDKIFDLARNRARSHDKILIVFSNPGLNSEPLTNCLTGKVATSYCQAFFHHWISKIFE